MQPTDPLVLRARAQALRHEELRRLACEAGLKWSTLIARLRG